MRAGGVAFALALLGGAGAQAFALGPVEIAPPISDGAVLQREAAILVSGTAEPFAALTLRLGPQTLKARADEDGRWTATLGPLPASFDPVSLEVADADGDRAVASGLLVGDVFLAAGQSNMAWPLQHAAGNNAVLRRRPPLASLRLFREPPRCASAPRSARGRWTGSGWDDAKRFSAIAYHFGQVYAAAEGVPVGIVLASRGGSPIDAWIPPGALPKDASARRSMTLEARDERREAFPAAMLAWLDANALRFETAEDPPVWPSDAELTHLPGCYWDGMISGLTATAFAGLLWYQGETDAHDGTDDYADRLEALLGAFRASWGTELPVVVFGLPPYRPEPRTAAIRAAQEAVAAADERTVLVPADEPTADPLELHPRPKRGPALRAVTAIRSLRNER